jgi:hypothetical protein
MRAQVLFTLEQSIGLDVQGKVTVFGMAICSQQDVSS